MDQNVLYLFSSNTRPRYLKDVLNVLGYPEGFTIHFRYERDLVQDSLWEQVTRGEPNLEATSVTISFVDQDPRPGSGQLPPVRTFSPMRTARLHKIETFEETLHVYFVVGTFYAYLGRNDPDYDHGLRAILAGDIPPSKYAALAPPLRQRVDVAQVGDAWKSVVEQLADVDRFRNEAVFVLVRGVRHVHAQKQRLVDLPVLRPKLVAPGGRAWLEFRPGQHYVIDLAFRTAGDPTPDVSEHQFAFTVDSALLSVPRTEHAALDARYDFRSFDTFVKMAERDTYTAMSLDLTMVSDRLPSIKAADITFPILIRYGRIRRLALFALEVGGIVAAAVGAALITTAVRDDDLGLTFGVGIALSAAGAVAISLRTFGRG